MVSTRRLCPCAWTGAARIGGAQHSYRHWRAAAPQSTRRGALSDAARPPVSSSGVGVYDTVEPPARCRAPAVNGKRYATDAVRPLATFSPWLRVWREKGREERRRQPPEQLFCMSLSLVVEFVVAQAAVVPASRRHRQSARVAIVAKMENAAFVGDGGVGTGRQRWRSASGVPAWRVRPFVCLCSYCVVGEVVVLWRRPSRLRPTAHVLPRRHDPIHSALRACCSVCVLPLECCSGKG